MNPLVREVVGWVVFAFGMSLYLFKEWFSLRLADALAALWNFFSDRRSRSSEVVFPAASLPEFPRGIPPLVNPTRIP